MSCQVKSVKLPSKRRPKRKSCPETRSQNHPYPAGRASRVHDRAASRPITGNWKPITLLYILGALGNCVTQKLDKQPQNRPRFWATGEKIPLSRGTGVESSRLRRFATDNRKPKTDNPSLYIRGQESVLLRKKCNLTSKIRGKRKSCPETRAKKNPARGREMVRARRITRTHKVKNYIF